MRASWKIILILNLNISRPFQAYVSRLQVQYNWSGPQLYVHHLAGLRAGREPSLEVRQRGVGGRGQG